MTFMVKGFHWLWNLLNTSRCKSKLALIIISSCKNISIAVKKSCMFLSSWNIYDVNHFLRAACIILKNYFLRSELICFYVLDTQGTITTFTPGVSFTSIGGNDGMVITTGDIDYLESLKLFD